MAEKSVLVPFLALLVIASVSQTARSATTTSCPEADREPTPWSYNEVCSTATEYRWHLPYPGDCRRFLKCGIVDKYVTGFKCCDPLLFNPKIQVCDWPNNVECDGGGSNPDPSPSTSKPTEGSTAPPQPSTAEPTPKPTFQPTPQPSTAEPTPKPTVQPTPQPSTAKPTEGPTAAPGGGSSTEGSCPEAQPEPTPWSYDQVCSTATEHHWHLPYPGDCTRFIKCGIVDKKVTGFKCCDPLRFNPAIQVCDWPDNVDCGDSSSPNPSPSTSKPTESSTAPPQPSTAEPTPQPTVQPTPQPSTAEPTPQPTVQPTPQPSTAKPTEGPTAAPGGGTSTEGSCPEAKPEPTPWSYDQVCSTATEHHWHLPYPGDCTRFIKCGIVDKKVTGFKCCDPLRFNPAIQVCDWPDNVDCGDSSSPNPSPSTSKPVTSNPSTSTSGSGGGSSGNDCPYPYGPNNVCGHATLDRWLVADPANKEKFYSCDIASCRAFNMDCALYTHFNEAIQRCDWPDNVPQ